jgi:transposase
MEMAKPHIEVFWLPHYCWNLNLIERLWKHLKATRIANVLLQSRRQFIEHVEAALEHFAAHPDLVLSAVGKSRQRNIHKNLLALT